VLARSFRVPRVWFPTKVTRGRNGLGSSKLSWRSLGRRCPENMWRFRPFTCLLAWPQAYPKPALVDCPGRYHKTTSQLCKAKRRMFGTLPLNPVVWVQLGRCDSERATRARVGARGRCRGAPPPHHRSLERPVQHPGHAVARGQCHLALPGNSLRPLERRDSCESDEEGLARDDRKIPLNENAQTPASYLEPSQHGYLLP
jgi:hypothetical protein